MADHQVEFINTFVQNDTSADISPPSTTIRETVFLDEPDIPASRELTLRPSRRIQANAPIDVYRARRTNTREING